MGGFAPASIAVGLPGILVSLYKNRRHGRPPDEMDDRDNEDGKGEKKGHVTRHTAHGPRLKAGSRKASGRLKARGGSTNPTLTEALATGDVRRGGHVSTEAEVGGELPGGSAVPVPAAAELSAARGHSGQQHYRHWSDRSML